MLLIAILAAAVAPLSSNLRERTRQAMIERDAAVLHVVALQQLAEAEAGASILPGRARELMTATLKSARQPGMLAVITFDANGKLLQAVPPSLLLPELSNADFLQLLGGARISRFHAQFPLDRHFREVSAAQREAPVLEILLPLHDAGDTETVGFAQYLIDARVLARELDTLDRQIQRQTGLIFGLGATLIALLGAGAYAGLRRAHAQIAERSERLARAQLELTLAAKASVLGQLTSHLIHGLQGPVAGLRAIIDQQRKTAASARPGSSESTSELHAPVSDLVSASAYTERLENLVRETVALLSDIQAQATYELTGDELLTLCRQRTGPVTADVTYQADANLLLDNHRGSVLSLIAANLAQNAAEAGATHITVALARRPTALALSVRDNGPGIPEALRPHLFEPGRSTRPGGTGLGLAISRLLARQIDADLTLERTGPEGTAFTVSLPQAPDVK